MSNENKDRKLKHHEKPIWRKAFEASMQHTSIEGATRNAWKAVDAWNQANAFNEEQESRDSDSRYRVAFRDLVDLYESHGRPSDKGHDDIVDLMIAFDERKLGFSTNDEFKLKLSKIDE